MAFGGPSSAAAGAVAAAVAAVWVITDYRRWRSLGVGGLPPTPAGWVRVTWMRIQGGDPLRDDLSGPVHPALQGLPDRGGSKPKVAPHPVPHRVLDQHASRSLVQTVQAMLEDLVDGTSVVFRTSGWEKHNQALYVASPPSSDLSRTSGGEFGHLHPSDGSMHVILSRGDAAVVIARGWGELHPLAGKMLRLPETYMMLYPPGRGEDVPVLRTIFEAARDNMAGARTASAGE